MWFAWTMLLACGDSATFDEPPVEDEPVEAVEEPVEIERAPEFEAPIDGRPEEYQAKTPQPGQPWPPITVPQDQLEREWDWDFKVKGGTRVEQERAAGNVREKTVKELDDIENESQAEMDKQGIQ